MDPNNSIFVENPTPKFNELGGDIGDDYTPSPADRGDLIDEDTNDDNDTNGTGDATVDSASSGDDDLPSDDEATTVGDESESEEGSDETETDDEDDDTEADAKADSDADNHKIPRSRLNKEAEKRKQAEERAKRAEQRIIELETAQSEAGEPQAEPEAAAPELSKDDFEKLQVAMLDENTEEAFELFKNMLNSGQPTKESLSTDDLRRELREELRVERQNERMSERAKAHATAYPELDSASNSADADMIGEVLELRGFYIEKGQDFADALDEAVNIVARKYELENRSETKAAKKAPKKKIDASKKLKAAEQEQGKLQGDGARAVERELDIRTLSDSQFAKLSEEAKRRARGDFV